MSLMLWLILSNVYSNFIIMEESIRWIFVQSLGIGTFGSVSLFKNKDTNELIALKKCNKQEDISERAKKRWNAECEIMLQLDHRNIVRAFPLDNQLLQLNPSPMPLLAMEYCEQGDLRKVLGLPENVFGLSEKEIRTISRDISSAIEYLHSKKIVHRDLKPENIVIKLDQDKFIYKLIDLGYAKDLTEGSVCTSFVGTLHYLAPELFTNTSKEYSRTVDYWSLGNTIFECITGFRPFQHNEALISWLSLIQAKKETHICLKYDDKKNGEYSDKIPVPNHLCRASQLFYEQWLRLMLKYEANLRGGEDDDPQIRPKCFEMLDEIMNTKILRIYKFESNIVTTIPIQTIENTCHLTHMIHLVKCLYQTVKQNEIIILLDKNGRNIGGHENPLKFCLSNMLEFSNEEVDVYIYKECSDISDIQESLIRNPKVKKRPVKLTKLYEFSKNDVLSLQEKLDYLKLLCYYSIELYNDARIFNMFCMAVQNRLTEIKKNFNWDQKKQYLQNEISKIGLLINHCQLNYKLDVKYMQENKIDSTNEHHLIKSSDEISSTKLSEMKSALKNLEIGFSSIRKAKIFNSHDCLEPLNKCVLESKNDFKKLKKNNDCNTVLPGDLRKKLDDLIMNFSSIYTLQVEIFKNFYCEIHEYKKIDEEINLLYEQLKNYAEFLQLSDLHRQKSIWNIITNAYNDENSNIQPTIEDTQFLCTESMNLQQQIKELTC